MTPRPYRRVCYFSLGLRTNTWDQDKAIGDSLHKCAGVFDAVILVCPSWQEVSHLMAHPLFARAVGSLTFGKVDIILGRRVFISWPNICQPDVIGLRFKDAFKREFHAEYLTRLRDEAAAMRACGLRVTGTYADVEPNGKDCPHLALKTSWEDWLGKLLANATLRARGMTGYAADIVGPTTGPQCYLWLGAHGYERSMMQQTRWQKPPLGWDGGYGGDWYGTTVAPDGMYAHGSHADNPQPCCTPAEALQFGESFARLQAEHMGILGHIIYAHSADAPVVLQMFQEAAK